MTLTDEQVRRGPRPGDDEIAFNRAMMERRHLWPLKSMLPVERRTDEGTELGTILWGYGSIVTTVFLCLFADVDRRARELAAQEGTVRDLFRRLADDFEREDFESIDALIDAGWRVD